MSNPKTLTISHAQSRQPWVLPLHEEIERAIAIDAIPYAFSSHAVLHATKSVGKLASVFENLEHTGKNITSEQRAEVAAMAADLVTIALRFANLHNFDLATALVERVAEKNGTPIPGWD